MGFALYIKHININFIAENRSIMADIFSGIFLFLLRERFGKQWVVTVSETNQYQVNRPMEPCKSECVNT